MKYSNVAIGVALAMATSAAAQNKGDGFLFHVPPATLTVHGGYALASAGSDLFSFSRQQLTLGKRSFDALHAGADLAIRATSRLDVVIGTSYAATTRPSEFREWLDNNDRPIEQKTTFTRWPVTIGAKYYITDRGRSLGQYAWVPSPHAAYVGAGGGAMWYNFTQRGDFVDFETLDVFYDEFRSNGWTPAAYVAGGFEYSLGPAWFVTSEMRYTRASGTPGSSFTGFNKIDLSGLTASIGLSARF